MAVDATERAQVLIEALPYIRRFHGRIVVIKLGGKAIDERKEETLLDVVLLRYVGMLPVIVHGGGAEITALSQKLGLQAKFETVAGHRRGDDGRGQDGSHRPHQPGPGGHHQPARRSGGGHVRRGRAEHHRRTAGPVPGAGRQGDPDQRRADHRPRRRCYVPVIASIGLGYDGKAYNINADTVAAELAVALGATKLLLVTDVPGSWTANGKLLSEITRQQAAALVQEGSVSGGMIPKVEAGLRALDSVEQAHIIDGRQAHSLLLELFTESGVGTMVTA